MEVNHILKNRLETRKKHLQTLKVEADRARSFTEKLADWVSGVFGSFSFAISHVVWFGVWILINTDLIPGIKPFDPYPFGLLTMAVSLEAIFLSIFVLISQNRAQKIADLREEMHLHITTQSEQEITETLKLVDRIATHLKIKTDTPATRLKRMEKDLDAGGLKKKIQTEIDEG